MRKIMLAVALAAAATAGTVPAAASPHHGQGQAKRCAKPRKVAFVVSGRFVSGDATSVTLTVRHANRHARKSGLVTLGDDYVASVSDPARIRYVNRSGPGDAQPTDKVKVVGKVTKLKHGCPDDGFTPTVTVRRIKVIGPSTESEETGS